MLIYKKKISVVGMGYIGLPFALLLASQGFIVKGIDINKKKISQIKNGEIILEEEELKSFFKKNYNKKNIEFSENYSISDFFILCLPTPLKKNNTCELNFIFNALKKIVNVLQKNNTIIIESTISIGDLEKLKNFVDKIRPDLINKYKICYVPEKAIPGNTIYEMQNNYRVIGSDLKTFKEVRKIYSKICKKKIIHTSVNEAEATKLIENAFRDNSIAFSNFISENLLKKGISYKKVFEICNLHPRVNILDPSIGVGGHCIPIDPYFLNFKKLNQIDLVDNSRQINDYKTKLIFKRILNFIQFNNKKKICLWGLGYKPGVADLRESPSIKIINKLKKMKIRFYVSDENYNLLKNHEVNIVNPTKALNSFDIHIILNVSQSFIQKKLKNKNYIYAKYLNP